MKYLICIIILLTFFTSSVFAATPTPTETEKETASPTEESKTNQLNKQINDLKDKIASRVAQLKLVDKRGIIGVVTEVKDTQISITDPQNKTRIIDIDEITKFSSPSAKSTFGISDISKGSTLSVIGLYNKQSRRILARFVETAVQPVFITGIVTDVDEDEFTVTILDENKKSTLVDIEKITKTNTYTEEDEITKSGFSKLDLGDRVVVTAYPQKEENRVTGLRILQLPDAPKNPGISYDYPNPSPTPSKRVSPTPEE